MSHLEHERLLLSRNFTYKELSCRCGCGFTPALHFITKLQDLRDYLGFALVITSGARCMDHNAAVGGVKNSFHVLGLAVDIECRDSETRYKIITAAIGHGFTGIGVSDGFVHLDIRPLVPRVFVY